MHKLLYDKRLSNKLLINLFIQTQLELLERVFPFVVSVVINL